jgi:integrase
VILLGRRGQEVLAPWLLKAGSPDAYVFSPARAEAERNAARSENRVTPRWPSHLKRNERKRAGVRRRRPGDRYTTRSVRQAIERACEKAGVPAFRPHQVRHLAGTEVRAELGPEVARAVLGHSLVAMTEHYSREVDRKLAMKAIEKFG